MPAFRLLSAVVGALTLTTSLSAQAEPSRPDMDALVAFVCGEDKEIKAAGENLWHETCNYRFEHEGAEIWVAYTATTIVAHGQDYALDPEDRAFCRKNPGVWCERPVEANLRPMRHFTVSVKWRVPNDDDPDDFVEDYVIDAGLVGIPSFGSIQTRAIIPQSFRYDAEEGMGLEHRERWTLRYHDLLEVVRSRMPHLGRGS